MNAASHLIAGVRLTLAALPQVENGLVVAVSGGPDSAALLRALLDARPAHTPLVVAHLNHQLRGADSEADAAFVADWHTTLAAHHANLRIEIHSCPIAADAKQSGANLEAHARQVRYRWLADVARRHNMHWIATGHTANDQAETVLHRLLRGTGLQGLRGIAPRRSLGPGIDVVRPLLTWTRTEVLSYLEALGQGYRVDATNDDRRLTRNRIRHELLPLLADQYNPAIVSLLGRLAHQAEEAFEEQDASAGQVLRAVELPRAGHMIVLDRGLLAALSRHRLRLVLRSIWQREQWPLDDMTHAAWERMATLVFEGTARIDLPGRIQMRARDCVVQLERSEAANDKV